MEQGKKWAGLDATQLKAIMLVLMVLDHIYDMFGYAPIPGWFHIAARLVAPIYLFLLAESFHYTHSRPRFFARVWLVAFVMGSVSFCMQVLGLWRRADGFYPLNGIFMNFPLLFCMWQGIDWLRTRKPGWMLAGLAALLAPWFVHEALVFLAALAPGLSLPLTWVGYAVVPDWRFITDGGQTYLLEGLVLYLFRGRRKLQLPAYAVTALALEFFYYGSLWRSWTPGFTWAQMFTNIEYCQWMSVFSVVLMALYNGRRGSGHGKIFYFFYPAHVYVLYALSCLLCPAA